MIVRCVCGKMMLIKSGTWKDCGQWGNAIKQRFAFMKNHQPCRKRMEKETNDAA